jgi:hypothetical protein
MGKRFAVPVLALVLLGVSACGGGDGGAPDTRPADQNRGPDARAVPEGTDAFAKIGREATARERAAISAAVRRYSAVIAARDWREACSLQSRYRHREYRKQGARCVDVLPDVYAAAPNTVNRSPAKVTIGRVRVDGRKAVAYYREGRQAETVIAFMRDGSAWKVGANLFG